MSLEQRTEPKTSNRAGLALLALLSSGAALAERPTGAERRFEGSSQELRESFGSAIEINKGLAEKTNNAALRAACNYLLEAHEAAVMAQVQNAIIPAGAIQNEETFKTLIHIGSIYVHEGDGNRAEFLAFLERYKKDREKAIATSLDHWNTKKKEYSADGMRGGSTRYNMAVGRAQAAEIELQKAKSFDPKSIGLEAKSIEESGEVGYWESRTIEDITLLNTAGLPYETQQQEVQQLLRNLNNQLAVTESGSATWDDLIAAKRRLDNYDLSIALGKSTTGNQAESTEMDSIAEGILRDGAGIDAREGALSLTSITTSKKRDESYDYSFRLKDELRWSRFEGDPFLSKFLKSFAEFSITRFELEVRTSGLAGEPSFNAGKAWENTLSNVEAAFSFIPETVPLLSEDGRYVVHTDLNKIFEKWEEDGITPNSLKASIELLKHITLDPSQTVATSLSMSRRAVLETIEETRPCYLDIPNPSYYGTESIGYATPLCNAMQDSLDNGKPKSELHLPYRDLTVNSRSDHRTLASYRVPNEEWDRPNTTLADFGGVLLTSIAQEEAIYKNGYEQ